MLNLKACCTMSKSEKQKGDDFLPIVKDIVINGKLINDNMSWLVKAIKKTKYQRNKQCYINILLLYHTQRIEWLKNNIKDKQILQSLMDEFSTNQE